MLLKALGGYLPLGGLVRWNATSEPRKGTPHTPLALPGAAAAAAVAAAGPVSSVGCKHVACIPWESSVEFVTTISLRYRP